MILTDENRKFIAEVIDDTIKAKGALELVDGFAAKILLNVVDSYIDKKIEVPETLKQGLNDLVEAAKEQDVEQCEVIAAEIIDSLVDIPGIDAEGEKLIFEGAIKLIIGAIKSWVSK